MFFKKKNTIDYNSIPRVYAQPEGGKFTFVWKRNQFSNTQYYVDIYYGLNNSEYKNIFISFTILCEPNGFISNVCGTIYRKYISPTDLKDGISFSYWYNGMRTTEYIPGMGKVKPKKYIELSKEEIDARYLITDAEINNCLWIIKFLGLNVNNLQNMCQDLVNNLQVNK